MKRALVTGAGGFVGKYLVGELLKSGHEVYGTGLAGEVLPAGCLSAGVMDLTAPATVAEVFRTVKPDEVFHLAAISAPVGGKPVAYVRVNVEGTLHVLEAAKECGSAARVLVVGSGLAYGECRGRIPSEADELRPIGFYGASKAAADLLSASVARTELEVLRARPFNHTGPGQAASFLLPAITRQAVEIELGLRAPTFEMGNLDSARDFTDVRDVVAGYLCIMENGIPGEAYNVCSGTAVTVRNLLELVLQLTGLSASVVSVPAKRRSDDISVLVGSPGKLEQLGWHRTIDLEQTILDLLNYWRSDLGRK